MANYIQILGKSNSGRNFLFLLVLHAVIDTCLIYRFHKKLPLVRADAGEKKKKQNKAHPGQQSRSEPGDSSLFAKHALESKQAPERSQGASVLLQTAAWSPAAWFSCWHLFTPFCVTEQLKTGALLWSGVTIRKPHLIVEHCWLLLSVATVMLAASVALHGLVLSRPCCSGFVRDFPISGYTSCCSRLVYSKQNCGGKRI